MLQFLGKSETIGWIRGIREIRIVFSLRAAYDKCVSKI